MVSGRSDVFHEARNDFLNFHSCARGDLNCSVPPRTQDHGSAFCRMIPRFPRSTPVDNCTAIHDLAGSVAHELAHEKQLTKILRNRPEALL